jgi:hypothetical protein
MDGAGDIAAAKKPTIVHYTNQALTSLYSRFMIKADNLIVVQRANITLYKLNSLHSLRNTSAPVGTPLYIDDTDDKPFADDLIKILSVYDQYSCELPINDIDDPASVFVPQPDVLQLPTPVGGMPLGVSYQARHSKLAADYGATIELPVYLEEALTAKIAAYVYSAMNSQESTAKAQEHEARYESICALVEDQDLLISSVATTNTKFGRRGFV